MKTAICAGVINPAKQITGAQAREAIHISAILKPVQRRADSVTQVDACFVSATMSQLNHAVPHKRMFA